MNRTQAKPRLVFFQYRYDDHLPEFLLIHKRDHVNCLSEHFDVTVISEDCDYQQICDKVEPDLALFESGVNHVSCRRLTIRNTRACPTVPKLGLHNADAFCNARSGFISDMDHWGIEHFFAICTTTPDHNPEIAANLFVWPNSIDPRTYRDYGVWKSIPVLFTGNTTSLYPWRRQIMKLVSRHYPSLVCPHPGYNPGAVGQQVLVGERYARTLNASMVVPACGTVAREAVRKHFEIPACNAVLVTERSAALEAAGFVDMENCVFADETNVVDKLDYLFRNPDELEAVARNGHRLAHERHTFRQRDQMLQWYRLNRDLRPNQKIVQDGPFGALRVVDRSSGIESAHVTSAGLHLTLMAKADERFGAERYDEAEDLYLQCLNFIEWMPEPRLKWALCKLYRGDAKTAYKWISEQVQFILAYYKAADPDPVEWAYFIVSLLCQGNLTLASRSARQFGWLHHPELERARLVVRMLHDDPEIVTQVPGATRRPSIHRLPDRAWSDWRDHVCRMLEACGQTRFAETLKQSAVRDRAVTRTADECADAVTPKNGTAVYRVFGWRARYQARRRIVRNRLLHYLQRAEARWGYFLPFHLSSISRDDGFREIVELVREADVRTALLVGAAGSGTKAAAVLAGTLEHDAEARAFCIDGDGRRLRRLTQTFGSRVIGYHLPSSTPAEFLRGVDEHLRAIKEDHRATVIDVVLVDGSALGNLAAPDDRLLQHLHQARLVIFENLTSPYTHERHTALLRDPHYVLVAHDPASRNGYAVFRRRQIAAAATAVDVKLAG